MASRIAFSSCWVSSALGLHQPRLPKTAVSSATVFVSKVGKTLCVPHPNDKAWVKSVERSGLWEKAADKRKGPTLN
ncbi:hypothetical protein KUCAC02_029223 [Chaenocephalus aceratus]|uniref:Uncharacterized protein n=1 Tax=Chaenocephalus aceratus TaxID=36190 RepID=A0ACB9X5Y4_CHAAC|nr:hypothetical protein KUCAC02_029223 [Chaenocephalus aceratus]